MRARRPELYSDTLKVEVTSMDRDQFEYYLDTLTQRKQEISFEHFARALAEKELCPNLIPQTGPTGGGDSKVDTETYPVSSEIAERWYEGAAHKGASERWGFAISAKKAWKPKIKSDVQKIIGTERAYSLIYFITNQPVRDKDRGEIEDELRTKYGVDVRVLDRTWIVEKVTINRRWNIVQQTLGLQLPRVETNILPGPLDSERLRDLKELDAQIENGEYYNGTVYQLADDCLQTALLARGLGRARAEIDGRFDRAMRLAVGRQVQRILYQRAWTAIWWFDDYIEADRIYDEIAPIAISSEWVWEVEDIVNLWLALAVRQYLDNSGDSNIVTQWAARTVSLRAALQRHANDISRLTNSLWARTLLLLMDLSEAAQHKERLPDIFRSFKQTLEEARYQIEYPVEALIRLVREFGAVVEDEDSYEELLEMVIALQRERTGNGEEGAMRLERGSQKLRAGKINEAIDQFAKAQILLAQEERRDEFIAALAGTALGYESAGLLWASRANLLVALDRCLYSYFKSGKIDQRALPLLRKAIWVELQLGRIPYALCWMEWLQLIIPVLNLSESQRESLNKEIESIDQVLGILVLRTKHSDWSQLDNICSVFEKYSLLMSNAAALFMLGHENKLREDYKIPDEDVQDFFSIWLEQPAADDIPKVSEWYTESTSNMHTALLGCKVTIISRGGGTSVLLAESLIAFLEAMFSTAIQIKGFISPRPELFIEVRQSEQAKKPFGIRTIEDDCGETRIVISHLPISAASIIGDHDYQEVMFKFFAHVVAELQVLAPTESLESLFTKYRAPDRAFIAARSIVSLDNILGPTPKYRAVDWNTLSGGERLAQIRAVPWIPTLKEKKTDEDPITFADGPPPEHLFGIDGLKHKDLTVMSPINMPLWDKAKWSGTGFMSYPQGKMSPHLILSFENAEEACKIFRGWQKKLGSVDESSWIGLTIITGISRAFPWHYRVVIGVSESYLRQKNMSSRFAMVYRLNDMTPKNSMNLDRFLSDYGMGKRFLLQPGDIAANNFETLNQYCSLGIELTKLTVTAAWKIEPNDPIVAALKNIDDPYIPEGVINPPILKTLERLRSI
jgi:hypothetical protein